MKCFQLISLSKHYKIMMRQTTLTFGSGRQPLAPLSSNSSNNKRPRDDDDPLPPPRKPPASLFARTFRSKAMVLRHLTAWIDALGPNHRFVGPLGGDGTQLKMPLASEDGRALTWRKFADEVSITFLFKF